MPPSKNPEALDFGSLPRSRSTSISSDTQLPRTSLLAPPPVTPPPAFIASSAASQIITADQEFNTVDFVADDRGGHAGGAGSSSATALVTPTALSHLNGFLDHLLFNILAISRSTQLSSVRPAVAEVLKPRLAREVVAAADDELSEYMGGEEDEEFEFHGDKEPTGDFDLVRSWKRTRLRCMVYTRLGDMEEDDEDEYIARDGLGELDSAPRRFASHVDNITPAAAIFITSIIEYLGEQALVIAGETSRSRLSTRRSVDPDEETEPGTERGRMGRLVVEDYDMEKLAMNATLGRLWRTWRKRIRSPNLSRTLSRESFRRRGIAPTLASSRKSSVATIDERPSRSVTSFATTDAQEEEVDPATIPLPMSENDVQDILFPGFLADRVVGETQTMEAVVAHKVRPRSLMVIPSPMSPRPPSSTSSSPVVSSDSQRNHRGRSQSLPNNSYFPLDIVPAGDDTADKEGAVDHTAGGLSSPTPSEERQRLETMYEQEEPTESQPGLAISTPSFEQVAKGSGPDSPNTPTNARHSVIAPSFSSVQVHVSRPGSAQTSSTIVEQQDNPEVIEGQGTSPRPASAIQRPRRKASGGPTKSSASGSTSSNGPAVPMVAEGAGESTRAAADYASKPSDAATPAGQTWFSNDDDDDEASPAIRRASVQRLPGKSSSTSSKSHRSDSISDKRPLTSGSGTSQVSSKLKGFIGRSPQGESASLRARASSETNRQSNGGTESPGLDELIHSEDTIHYTLTPKGMREMDEPDSARLKARSSTAELADFLKSTAPPGDEAPQVAGPKPPSKQALPKSKYQTIPTIQAPKAAPSPRQKASQARDAKPAGGSTREFADFLKSSGPDAPPDTPKSPAPSSTRARRLSDATELSKKFIRPGSALSTSTRSTSGSRLQARSAVIPKGEQTSELIDFIREGPPTPGSHRISRSVAPFRDTMDSEDLNNSVAAQKPRASTPDDAVGGSRTALMESANRANAAVKPPAPTPSSGPAASSGNAFDDDPMPVRKQRRVPDPYAIDDDDDEELEELLGLQQQKPQREEESLIDFLRNVPPPESETTPTQPLTTTNPVAPNKTLGGGFASASAMKARIRNGMADRGPASKASKSSLRSTKTAPGSSNYATKVGVERAGNRPAVNPAHTKPPVMPNKETDTSSLADFLKNTGPPEPARPPPKDSNGLSRFLMRRKKAEA